jgi:hypothetical protein
MSLWGWVADFDRRARQAGDSDRARLVSLLQQTSGYRERDPGRFLALCEEGLRLAQRLREPWWVLCYRALVLQALVHHLRDFRKALDQAVALTLEARKSAYDGCPLRALVYQDLLAVHFCTDPEGYADRIEAGFREVEGLIPTDLGSRLWLLNLRRWRAEQSRQPEEHYAAAQRVLALIAADPGHHSALHYGSFVYNGLCHMNFSAGRWHELGEAAVLAEEASEKSGNRVELATALLWQALLAFQRGQTAQGRRRRRRGVRVMGDLGVPPPDGYFAALSLGHEHQGQMEEALAVQERELTMLRAQGRTISEVYCHRERCRLLLGLGRLTVPDLDAGRAAARRLRSPERHLAALDQFARR